MTISADLSGKKALVTGASSSGFGRYFAETLARSGAHVVVTARRLTPLQQLVDEIRQDGGSADAMTMDVSKVEDVEATLSKAGTFDIVVNNAGVERSNPILEQSPDDYDIVLDINLKGVWNVATTAARDMRKAAVGGSIINIASITGLRPVGHLTPYAVSKAGVIHLTKQMALELARFNIRVNAIAPGYFETDMTREQFETPAGQALLKRIPMRRWGDYESLGGTLLLLASESSSFITGSIIPVDGGHLVNGL